MKNINKLNIFAFARFHGIIFTWIGLSFGILYSVGGAIVDLFTTGLNQGSALAFGALIGMPVIGLVVGLAVGLITGLVYNILSKWVDINTNF